MRMTNAQFPLPWNYFNPLTIFWLLTKSLLWVISWVAMVEEKILTSEEFSLCLWLASVLLFYFLYSVFVNSYCPCLYFPLYHCFLFCFCFTLIYYFWSCLVPFDVVRRKNMLFLCTFSKVKGYCKIISFCLF
jgi:hypothetical protein